MVELNDEQRGLVESNLRLVDFVIRSKLAVGQDDYEDLKQEGVYWLCVAASRFDSNYGTKFSTYAAKMIMGGLYRYKRDKSEKWHGLHVQRSIKDSSNKVLIELNKRGINECDVEEFNKMLVELGIDDFESIRFISLQKPVSDVDGHECSVEDFCPVLEEGYDEVEFCLFFKDIDEMMKSSLSERDYRIFSDCVSHFNSTGRFLKQRDIARMYGISQSMASRILSRVKYKLRMAYLQV